jgi:periplasmic protein CpxP/Spy
MKAWIKRTIAAVFGVTLIAGLTACGSHRHNDWSPERVTEMRGKVLERAGSKLNLNEAQKQKLGLLADEMLAARTALRGTGAEPRAEFKALIAGTTFDRSAAQALLASKTQTVQGHSPKVITAMAEFFDSLNPQQQQQLRDFMDKRGHRWGRG